MRRHSPYNYAFNNPITYIDPDRMAPGRPGPGIGSNPLYTMAEGWRRYMQAGLKPIDNFFASMSTTTSKIIKSVKGRIGIAATKVTTSVDITNSTTARTNLGGFLNTNGRNTPSEGMFRFENTFDISQKTTVEAQATIRGIYATATNDRNTFFTTVKINDESNKLGIEEYLKNGYSELKGSNIEKFVGCTIQKITLRERSCYYAEYVTLYDREEYFAYSMVFKVNGFIYDIALKIRKGASLKYKETFQNVLYNFKVDDKNIFTELDEIKKIDKIDISKL